MMMHGLANPKFPTEFCSDILPLKETLSGGYVDVLIV
jgi:hypothetical protein